jgi:conjugative transfer signal peptidase TraF
MIRAPRLSMALVAALAAGALVVPRQDPALIWNATASTPIGLYALRPTVRLHAMELVAIAPPKPIATFLANSGFLPEGGLLLKHVLALAGQTVCRFDRHITIDGNDAGEAKERDHLSRPLPVWSGCQTLQPDEVFLMNPSVSDSLDGRYFGPLPITSIIGRAMPLWTDEANDRRFTRSASDH